MIAFLITIAIVILLIFLRKKHRTEEGQQEEKAEEQTEEQERQQESGGIEQVDTEERQEESGGTQQAEQQQEREKYPLDYSEVYRVFKSRNELSKILTHIDDFIKRNADTLKLYPFPVNPYAFTLAVRQQESGRPGREFGIMHPDALDTDLETQLEWFLATLLKDSIRWHTGKLWQGWNKSDFVDFLQYFARKYAPIGASNDPQNLNRFWEVNVRFLYELFSPKGGEKR
jgi:hypothetical protein